MEPEPVVKQEQESSASHLNLLNQQSKGRPVTELTDKLSKNPPNHESSFNIQKLLLNTNEQKQIHEEDNDKQLLLTSVELPKNVKTETSKELGIPNIETNVPKPVFSQTKPIKKFIELPKNVKLEPYHPKSIEQPEISILDLHNTFKSESVNSVSQENIILSDNKNSGEAIELTTNLKPDSFNLELTNPFDDFDNGKTVHNSKDNVEPEVPKLISLPKNVKLEPCDKTFEDIKQSVSFTQLNPQVELTKSIILPKTLKLEPYCGKPVESLVAKPIILPRNLKLQPYTKPVEFMESIVEPEVPKPIVLPKNLKLEPFIDSDVEKGDKTQVSSASIIENAVPKPIILPQNLKLEHYTKSFESTELLKMENGPSENLSLTNFNQPEKCLDVDFSIPKPIALPKGFKIEPIPKHLEIPIPEPFPIDYNARNLENFSQNYFVGKDGTLGRSNMHNPYTIGETHNHPLLVTPRKQPIFGNSKMVVDTDHSKYTYPMPMLSPNQALNFNVFREHCYARPWNWTPEMAFLKPAKTLFVEKSAVKRLFDKAAPSKNVKDQEIDVEEVPKSGINPLYDVEKATQLMNECARQASLIRGSVDQDWEEKVNKNNWTPVQQRLYNGLVVILNNYHLAKLSQSGSVSEPILRRTAIDKAVSKTRRLFATVSLDLKLLQWLHNVMLDNLDQSYLADYFDILQTLKAKIPHFIDKMIHGSQRIGALSIENINNITKKPWDPVAASLNQDKPKKLPGGPIIILVPSGPVHTKRAHKWIQALGNLGNVVSVPTNFTGTGSRLTMTGCLDQLFALTRGRVLEMRETYPGKHIILVGFGAGATLAIQVAQVETVFCVVSLGFSLLTAEGRRGEADDSLLELQCPVLFVIGQSSSTCLQEDLEDLRSRMRIETGLIVVGSADNNLIVSKKRKRAEGITQSIVNRCIIDEIGEFISNLILSPFPPQIRKSPVPMPEIVPKKPQVAPPLPKSGERKRYNSTMSDDSEPPSPSSGPVSSRMRSVGRPLGASRVKSKLETKWAAQVAKGTNPSIPSTSQNTSSTLSASSLNDPTVINLSDDSDTASASDNHSPATPHKPQKPGTPSKSPSKGIMLAKTNTSVNSAIIRHLLSPNRKLKAVNSVSAPSPVTKTLVNSTIDGDRTVKVTIGTGQKDTARIQAYQLNKNLPLKGQLSTLLQGGIKTIPPVHSKPTIKVLENVQLTGHATAKIISTATGRSIDLSKLTNVNAVGGNVMLLPDGKIKAVKASPVKTVSADIANKEDPNSLDISYPGSLTSSDISSPSSCKSIGNSYNETEGLSQTSKHISVLNNPNLRFNEIEQCENSEETHEYQTSEGPNPLSTSQNHDSNNISEAIQDNKSPSENTCFPNPVSTLQVQNNDNNSNITGSDEGSGSFYESYETGYTASKFIPYKQKHAYPHYNKYGHAQRESYYSHAQGSPGQNAPSCNVSNMASNHTQSAPVAHPPPPRYGRPLFPLPQMSFSGDFNFKHPFPMMMKRTRGVPRRQQPAMVFARGQGRPLKKHTYVPLPSQSMAPPSNLTSQDIMDLPIIFADDNQVIDSNNVPTDLSSTGTTSQKPKIVTSAAGASISANSKYVIVNKPPIVVTPQSLKRPVSMSAVKQPPNKYAKIILSKRGVEQNIRLNAVKHPSDATPKSSPQVEPQMDLEQQLKTNVLCKPKSGPIKFTKASILPKNATIQAFQKMEETAAQEEQDPDYEPPPGLKY